ncbi:cobalt-precorrin 5A hydrolase [Candidatus Electronema sp. PJ]|uniref:cobalt-precorrin 5A hydrolase n=1 Tax=Candidatus Electronema sp. PJ TaxID=3401572 RepID=UPI003AA843FF
MSQGKAIAILALTKGGKELATRLAALLPESEVVSNQAGISKTLAHVWQDYEQLLCIMAAGIVVRALAPLLCDKTTDPAVVVCDEQGQFAVSLLSGHLGGGNALARQVAALLGGQAVITTASDVLGHTALDLWARDLGLVVADRDRLTQVMAKLVNSGSVRLYSEYPLPELPKDIQRTTDPEAADLLISCRTNWPAQKVLLHPQSLVVGIGCNRNTSRQEIAEALRQTCLENGLAYQAVARLATIDLKKDEPGLLALTQDQGCALELLFHTAEELNSVEGISTSAAVLRATGAKAVAEPAAILSSGNGPLLVRKTKYPNVTVAIAEINCFSCSGES